MHTLTFVAEPYPYYILYPDERRVGSTPAVAIRSFFLPLFFWSYLIFFPLGIPDLMKLATYKSTKYAVVFVIMESLVYSTGDSVQSSGLSALLGAQARVTIEESSIPTYLTIPLSRPTQPGWLLPP